MDGHLDNNFGKNMFVNNDVEYITATSQIDNTYSAPVINNIL
jgi:hypothetical protein